MEHLIIFTRFPEPGKTKTRMIGKLGANGASDLQKQMTEHSLIQARKLSIARNISLEVRYEGGKESQLKKWLGPDLVFNAQGTGDLGRRMSNAFIQGFGSNKSSVVLMGSDVPGFSPVILEKAFSALNEKDIVLGPATDGGYYLIGLKKNIPAETSNKLFQNIEWGTSKVLESTITIARRLGIDYKLLEALSDVDRPEDLPIWEKTAKKCRYGLHPEQISIIIPTINEAKTLIKTIKCAGNDGKTEIIVVDGGSDDNTLDIAQSKGVKIVKSIPPKSNQMNQGALHASGDIFLFLHADTLLPENYYKLIMDSLSNGEIAAGAFKLGIDSPKLKMRLVEMMTNFRSGILKFPYGDQAIFTKSTTFFKNNGFPDIPIMEDFEFIKKIKKMGKVTILPASVKTSSRRWNTLGVIKTTIMNQFIVIAYYAGVSPNSLYRWYNREKNIENSS